MLYHNKSKAKEAYYLYPFKNYLPTNKTYRHPAYFYLFFSMKKILVFFLLAASAASPQINPANITIACDSFGVPHIFAPTLLVSGNLQTRAYQVDLLKFKM